ncbi:hypothetical protein [Paenibacillus taiwanensis]|uniref:hypothetical protein n=1 Tax=Paenibacillus taiwanensis TaxID=401638 RepID=UPI0004915ED8|nr:hypothetical protein [Paenibacillus taiwanensis]
MTTIALNQRFTRLLTQAQRARTILTTIAKMNKVVREEAEWHLSRINASLVLLWEEPSMTSIRFLRNDIRRSFRYVTRTRRLDRKHTPTSVPTSTRTRCSRTFEIGYCLSHRTGNFEVTYANLAVSPYDRPRLTTVIILPRAFHRIVPEVHERSIAGCVEINYAQMVKLGFFIEQVSIA